MTDQDTEVDLALDEILACEHAVWRALVEGGPSVERYALTETRLLEVGEDQRLLCYRAEYLRIGKTQSESTYVSSLWQRTGAGWKNLFSQDTPVGDPLGV